MAKVAKTRPAQSLGNQRGPINKKKEISLRRAPRQYWKPVKSWAQIRNNESSRTRVYQRGVESARQNATRVGGHSKRISHPNIVRSLKSSQRNTRRKSTQRSHRSLPKEMRVRGSSQSQTTIRKKSMVKDQIRRPTSKVATRVAVWTMKHPRIKKLKEMGKSWKKMKLKRMILTK